MTAVVSSNGSKPLDSEPEAKVATVNGGKNIEWYIQKPPSLTETQRDLLEKYSGIPSEEVIPHVQRIRDQLWSVWPFPCIGVYRFIDFGLSSMTSYPMIISRVQAGASLLDFGCCCGQDLRKLVHDGTPSDNLYGADLYRGLMDGGYDLFLDKSTFRGKFVQADIFEGDEGELKALDGKMDIVYCGLFFHCFDLEGQVRAGVRVVKLMKDKLGVTVVGRQIGSVKPMLASIGGQGGSVSYRHNVESFKKYWAVVGEKTGTRWSVAANLEDVDAKGTANQQMKSKVLFFEIMRIA